MANVSSSNGLEKLPKLRFPGFDEPWKCSTLSQLFDYERPDKYIVSSENYAANGNIPVLTANQSFILGYTDDADGIYQKGEVIVFDDFTCDIKYANFPFKVKSSAIKLLTAHENMPIYFGYSLLRHINYKPMGHARHWISVLQSYMTSIPSLSEQQKISDFLRLIDQRIAYQTKYIETLKKYKRGVVQQVFSERNENKRTRYPEWKLSSLGEYFTEQTIRTSNSSATPLVSLTVENGITPKTERYYREFLVTKEGDNYKAIKPGWFAYNPMNAHLGAIAPNHLGYTAAVSGYYNIFSVNEIDTVNFWEEYLTSYPMLIHYKLIATGSLIEKQRVHYSQFVGIRRKLPSLEEQKHLSKIFQALNAKITNAESMEHQLIKLRTSLLQQLFI